LFSWFLRLHPFPKLIAIRIEKPGTESPETGELSFGGWIWRYDLEAASDLVA